MAFSEHVSGGVPHPPTVYHLMGSIHIALCNLEIGTILATTSTPSLGSMTLNFVAYTLLGFFFRGGGKMSTHNGADALFQACLPSPTTSSFSVRTGYIPRGSVACCFQECLRGRQLQAGGSLSILLHRSRKGVPVCHSCELPFLSRAPSLMCFVCPAGSRNYKLGME